MKHRARFGRRKNAINRAYHDWMAQHPRTVRGEHIAQTDLSHRLYTARRTK